MIELAPKEKSKIKALLLLSCVNVAKVCNQLQELSDLTKKQSRLNSSEYLTKAGEV